MRLRFRAHLALVAVLVTSSSCAAPLQNGGVDVRPGAEERLEQICRYRGSGGQQVCEPAAQNDE